MSQPTIFFGRDNGTRHRLSIYFFDGALQIKGVKSVPPQTSDPRVPARPGPTPPALAPRVPWLGGKRNGVGKHVTDTDCGACTAGRSC